MAQRQFRSDDTDQWVYGYGDGSDGALTISSDTTEAPIDSACTGTAGASTLSATNASFATGQVVLIHQTRHASTAGVWELNKIASYVAGTISLVHPLINTYAALSQVRVLKQYSSVTIDSGKTYTAKAWDGTVGGILGFLCSGTVTVTGNISATGKGFRYGSGAVSAGQATSGEGNTAAQASQYTPNGSGGGGGQGNDSGGGGGAYAANGSNGATYGGNVGQGGIAAGVAALTTLLFGGGGGGSSEKNTPAGGIGGSGGGIVLIIANDLSIAGTVVSAGNASVSGGDGNSVSGGGGAGGSILVKGKTLALGTNKVTATAGAAAAADKKGGDGSVGRIHADYKTTLTGTTTPTIDSTEDNTLDYVYEGAFIYNLL